ncbi:universal stress protein [Thalassorhabdus alkalitolerans]|uniref:Universal stress protein n=1 Tax=Thalassorhabdus alkalitolerans TaxID=2282697 RepID=A0ABW0YRD8_9BACI
MFKKAVVGVDGSELSIKAITHVLNLKGVISEVDLLFVVDGSHMKVDFSDGWKGLGLSKVKEERLKHLEKEVIESGVCCKKHILRGDPAVGITSFAAANKSDLIVLGSRGLNSLQQFILGSVSEKVLHTSPCTVLIIK